MSKLILVGAGPGDEELITLKGIKALQQADAVLYDALANPALLKHCKLDCEKIFVGKRAGLHYLTQRQTNRLILSLIRQGKKVVRLKGGDPFIFGRGHEEMEYINQYGIETKVIPGISSCVAVPSSQNIPVTKRGINESFWVVTGTTKSEKSSTDLKLAAQSSATVVILMGMKNIHDIISVFKKHRGAKEPIGVIMNGTTDKENAGYGKLDTIEEIIQHKKLTSPAIIIIGKVVSERLKIQHTNPVSEEINHLIGKYL